MYARNSFARTLRPSNRDTSSKSSDSTPIKYANGQNANPSNAFRYITRDLDCVTVHGTIS